MEIYDFLKSQGFKLNEQNKSKHFGDYYKLFSNSIVELRFSSSKSFETVDICSIEEKENWYDLALIKALLYKKENLNEITTFDEHKGFLQKELDHIIELFSKENYPTTRKRLEELGNKRAKQMFPGKI